MTIRTATIQDLDTIVKIEQACFPAAEAAARQSFEQRLTCYPNHFWLLLEDGKIIAFVNGLTTDTPDLQDEMYDQACLHQEQGKWQMIFGVDTVPECRRRGCAGMLLEHVIQEARRQGRKGLVLTCKEKLLHYYAKFGFINEGISQSTHGDVTWYQMRLKF